MPSPARATAPATSGERFPARPGAARLGCALSVVTGGGRAEGLGAFAIESERLILRRPRAADIDGLAAMAADPSMFRYSERGPMSEEEAWSMLLRHIGQWSTGRYGVFAVEEKLTGAYVGQVGPSEFRRGLGARFDDRPEMTWSIAAAHRGRGYASEAAAAALDWLHRELAPPFSVCLIHSANLASLRVARTLGYRAFRQCDYRGYPAMLFERMAVAPGAVREPRAHESPKGPPITACGRG